MKTKILLLTIVLSLVSQLNFAQDKQFNFGFKVAPAISWLGIDHPLLSTDGSSPKFNWGFFGAYNFSENYSVLSGFNVNALGGKLRIEGLSEGMKSKYSEFQIPAVFQMKTNEIGNLKYFVQIGLAAGYVFKAKDNENNDIKDYTNPLTTSYILSAGAEYPVSGGVSLLAQIKYNGGLTNITKSDKYEPIEDVKAKANFIELGLGVMF